MLEIKPIQERVMVNLAHYKFLTISQLMRLKSGSKLRTQEAIRILREAGLVETSRYGGVTRNGAGRVESISYLTSKGAKILVENNHHLNLPVVKYPKSINSIFKNDYLHRISTINTQISFEEWAKLNGQDVAFFHTYFDKLGSQIRQEEDMPLQSITRLNFKNDTYIEPDAIFLSEGNGKKSFFILEVCNGKDTKRHVEQIRQNVYAIYNGIPSDKYKQNKSPRLLCIFETENQLGLVLDKMAEDDYFQADWIEQAIFLNVSGQVWQSFADKWTTAKRQAINLSNL